MRNAHLLASLGLLGAVPLPAQAFEFVIDGRQRFIGGPWEPEIVSLAGTPFAPAAGDLIKVGKALVRLDGPERYDFIEELKAKGQVLRRRGDRQEVVVLAAHLLAAADEATCRALRGVYVDRWDEAIAAAIARLDPFVPVVITDGAVVGSERALPPLPAKLRHLALHWESREGFGDLAAAAQLTELLSLELGGSYCGFARVNLAPFGNASRLQYFRCEQYDLEGTEAVQRLRALRSFEAKDFPLPVDALAGLTELRRLWMWGPRHIEPRSLTPLAALPELRDLELLFTPVGVLPAEGFPRLERLYLQGCRLPVAQQRQFARAHPMCRIEGEVDAEQLRTTLATADRVVVRSGSPGRDGERVLYETGEGEQVRKVAAMLQVEDDAGGFHCMCSGSPTLVFFAGEKKVAEIGMHHGVSVRWDKGPWNSDARLLPAPAQDLATWLAKHGAPGPAMERRQMQQRRESQHHRARLRAAVFGEVLAADASIGEVEERWQASLKQSPDPVRIIALLGCHEGAWDTPDEFDRFAIEQFATAAVGADAWQRLLERARADGRFAIGLAALMTEDGIRGKLAPATLAALLPVAVPAALSHPQSWNRARMLQVLRDVPGEVATSLLRDALADRFTPREVASRELVAPGGMAAIHPADPVLDEQRASIPVLAAICLAARKDQDSLPAIRALLERCSVREQRLVQKAAEALAALK